jgi:hypothetical protein
VVYQLRELGQPTPIWIMFIEPDIVEPKNIGWQGFVPVATKPNYLPIALGLDIEYDAMEQLQALKM